MGVLKGWEVEDWKSGNYTTVHNFHMCNVNNANRASFFMVLNTKLFSFASLLIVG